MLDKEKNKTIGHFSVLAGLWFINILIVIFGAPFLLFKKLKEIFQKSFKRASLKADDSESTQYFPCRN